MSRFKVYVDEANRLCTEVGSVLRPATAEEAEAAAATPEGSIECPEDVLDRLAIDPDDGTTRLKGGLA